MSQLPDTPKPVTTPVTPKDAAAMILFRHPADPELFWVKRSPRLTFQGGWHAYPGGQLEAGDYAVTVLNCDASDLAAARVAAVREVFEETGLLVARGVEALSGARLAELREELLAERLTFGALLAQANLTIDAEMLTEAPRWVTPPSVPKRFNTFFFTAWVPDCQDGAQPAHIIPGELESGEWLRPPEAIERWRNGEILIAPPVLRPIQEMVRGLDGFVARLRTALETESSFPYEFRRGFRMCPLRTPTLPPATHTNCYIIGGEELVVIDPGSPYPEEQQVLDEVLERLLEKGHRLREVIITHLHVDHIGGVNHLREKFHVPVAAHRLTAEVLADSIPVDRFIEDDDLIELPGGDFDPDLTWRLRALWSPGHARGHLSFYEERTGSLLTGDCILGMGTAVIAPPEGNMLDYLASLERMKALPRLTALLPAHGPAQAQVSQIIEYYLAHRQEREAKIIAALATEALSIPELVKMIYTDVPVSRHQFAELSVQAHLEKLETEGRVARQGERFTLN